ncbi:heterokaryon incompatibility protein-domain-containing protein [Cercophora scortea]|uniref:Heterokaryon incompatibility protein-domain-containing protein n=1 Tax=Cercophora scortea TaxID=314031 RepID=A0AAE0M4H5_9PEZI|nr:heterokaryon incompatibility protein-domain-containing protein [Cercophora scortea]
MARQLLDTCLAGCQSNGHKKCQVDKQPLLPTRVLSIDNDDMQFVRLHESTPKQCDQYVALSYVWGMKKQPVTTTEATLQNHVTGIPVSSLPQTIQDAVTTTAKLGLRYLWVDVLCIIQDKGHPDKKRELKKMGDYYQNATLTIAAAVASTVADGFLHPRTPSPACQLPLYAPNGPSGIISITAKVSHEQTPEPLYTRAWTLEEFLLPPRLLIFGTREAIWQCNSSDPKPVIPSNVEYDPAFPCRRLQTKDRRRDIWSSVVANYTRRDMTYIEDRLPAIDGFARVLERKWNDRYLYGLWHSRLHSHLMWGIVRGNISVLNDKTASPGSGPGISSAPDIPAVSADGIDVFSKSTAAMTVTETNNAATNPANPKVPSWSWAAAEAGEIRISPLFTQRNSAVIQSVDGVGGGDKKQLSLLAVVQPWKELVPMIAKAQAEPDGKPENGKGTWSGVHDDADRYQHDDSLKFVLLGFHDLGAFGLLVRPLGLDGNLYQRVGMVKRFLPGDLVCWGAAKETVVIV